METDRLILRNYKESDKEEFYLLNSSVKVMEFFPRVLTREESDNGLEAIKSNIDRDGYGFWAVELKLTKELIGFVGLNKPNYKTPKEGCIEIGWRIRKQFWGNGYATEAALKSLEFGFEQLKLEEIIAFTPVLNTRSRKVMERIGMKNLNLNFVHPKVDPNSFIAEHVLYSIKKSELL